MKLNNKGFTLVELLAVIVVLGIVTTIGTSSVLSIQSKMKKQAFKEKVGLIIGAAKSWGSDNKETINASTVKVNNIKGVKKTVSDLILTGNSYLTPDKTVATSDVKGYTCPSQNIKDGKCYYMTNDETGEVVSNIEVFIYLKNGRSYACLTDTTTNKNLLKDTSKTIFTDYYC